VNTPRKILFGKEETPQSFRAMLISLLVAFGILIGGMFWTYRVGLEANQYDHQLSHAQEAVESLQQSAQHTKGTKP
jgi:archaellum component FlaF (FlaF/FlaG flagellin family)